MPTRNSAKLDAAQAGSRPLLPPKERERLAQEIARSHAKLALLAVLAALNVKQFCSLFGVSRPVLYRLWAAGEGPESYFVGKRRLISRKAADDWQRNREGRAKAEPQ